MNPASRVSAIYNKLQQQSDANHVTTGVVWSTVLGIPIQSSRIDEDAVATALLTLGDEIELAQARLADRGCPADLYRTHYARLRAVASPTTLGTEWRSHKAGLP